MAPRIIPPSMFVTRSRAKAGSAQPEDHVARTRPNTREPHAADAHTLTTALAGKRKGPVPSGPLVMRKSPTEHPAPPALSSSPPPPAVPAPHVRPKPKRTAKGAVAPAQSDGSAPVRSKDRKATGKDIQASKPIAEVPKGNALVPNVYVCVLPSSTRTHFHVVFSSVLPAARRVREPASPTLKPAVRTRAQTLNM